MTTFSLPAGKYWIGDLCYVIDDDTWQNRVCKESFDERGRSLDVKLEVPGGVLVIGHTAYGDGCYRGSDGFYYGVDSGTLGICSAAACTRTDDPSPDCGWFFVSDKDFNVSVGDGKFDFKFVYIDTDGSDTECSYCGDSECQGECQDEDDEEVDEEESSDV